MKIVNKMLLIDDDEISNLIMSDVVKDTNLVKEFHSKSGGNEALNFLSECAKTDAFPDLICVDLNMQEMDGFEFILHFEQLFYPKYPETKVIVLSGSIRNQDQQESKKFSSVARFINKPLTEAKLTAFIQSL